jgi:uncharacterized protein YjbI with pentapeptide repeats
MTYFDQSVYEGQTFKNIHDPTAQVEGVVFQACTFENGHFAESVWRKCRFENCTFTGCDLSEANFTGATGYAINAAQNTLHQTKFPLPEALSLLHSLDIILED